MNLWLACEGVFLIDIKSDLNKTQKCEDDTFVSDIFKSD